MKKSILKKIVACVLSLILMSSFFSVALAAENEGATPVIVIGGMNSAGMYSEETGEFVFPPSDGVISDLLEGMKTPLVSTIIGENPSILATAFAKELYEMFEIVRCDENGVPVHDEVVTSDFSYPISYYEYYFGDSTLYQQAVARAVGENIGADRTYFFNYDWRLSPLDHADKLNEMVERAKTRAGVDKVRLVCLSMGATVLSSYIYEYGTDSIDSVTYGSSAIGGVDLVGNLMTGKIDLNSAGLLRYLFEIFKGQLIFDDTLNLAINIFDELGNVELVIDEFLDTIIDTIQEPVYDEAISETYATMFGVWSLVPSEYYEAAKTYVSQYIDLSDEFYAKTDEYIYNVQMKAEDLLVQAKADGVEVYFVGSYGFTGIPATPAYTTYSDILIDTDNMLPGCTIAKYGETLENMDYSASKIYCNDTNHKHISTDNIIDASTSKFADTTWAIKNMTHSEFKYDTVPCDLITWIATSSDAVDVYSNELYPQFVNYNARNNTFSSLTDGVELEGDERNADRNFIEKILSFIDDFMKILNDIFDIHIKNFK